VSRRISRAGLRAVALMGLTPGQRTLRARIGAYSLHARRSAQDTTASARAKFLERFSYEVDPECRLEPRERARRAEAARRAYFARLALRSARRRGRRRRVASTGTTIRPPRGSSAPTQ
jgi:hypothetical protein